MKPLKLIPSRPNLPLCQLAALLLAGINIVTATGSSNYSWPPDRQHFDQDIEIVSEFDSLQGHSNYLYEGANFSLKIDVLEGDLVTWKRDDSVLQHGHDSVLEIHNLEINKAGNYRATLTRDGIQVSSRPLVINVVSPPNGTVVDATFNAQRIVGLEAIPLAARPDGSILVLYIDGGLYSRRWVILDSDGQQQELILEERGGLTGNNLIKVFADGSYLFRKAGDFKLHLLDGSTHSPLISNELLGDSDRLIKSANHQWIVADSIDLRGFDAQGTLSFAKNVSDYGVITIEELSRPKFSEDRFLLIGSTEVEPSRYTNVAILVEANGSPVEDFKWIEFENDIPTQLRSGGWAHFETGTLRSFDSNGNMIETVEIPELSLTSLTAISPDGWLYAMARSGGVIRFDLQGIRDPHFAFHFSPAHSSFSPRIVFDQNDQPILSIRHDRGTNTDDSQIIRLRPDGSVSDLPMILTTIASGSVSPREPWQVSGLAIGSGPVEYQWQRLDRPGAAPLPAGPLLAFDALEAEDLGLFQLRVTSPQGSVSGEVIDTRLHSRPHLGNLSGRGRVDDKNDLVAGFVTERWTRLDVPPSQSSTQVLLRGVGPTLADFNVNTPLVDPILFFENRRTGDIQTNDDWYALDPNTDFLMRAQGIFPLRENSADSHLVSDLRTGVYTSSIRSQNEASGIALAEIQTLTHTNEVELSNLSLRGNVGTGADVLIGGFIIADPGGFERPLRLLIRAVGPTLKDFDVADVCRDPQLTLFNSAGAQIATNDDWEAGSDADIAAIASSLGAFELPAGSKDAALLIELPPGAYTGHITDNEGNGGQALFEIYRIPPE